MLKAVRKFGDPILSQVSVPVDNKVIVEQIAQDLRDTLKRHKICVGLAAPQIGYAHRVILVSGDIIMVNPEIINKQGNQLIVEGCMSYPGVFTKVSRPIAINVEYLDENMEKQELVLSGLTAAVCCHEIDHLNGVCAVKPSRKRSA